MTSRVGWAPAAGRSSPSLPPSVARIPDDELERLKRETDLVALVQAAGVELRRHGANLVGRCPLHAPDTTPSLVITRTSRGGCTCANHSLAPRSIRDAKGSKRVSTVNAWPLGGKLWKGTTEQRAPVSVTLSWFSGNGP
ncbi:MAG: CHC2 zinc finger domain-containing protein [Gemmatimonadaceae bacterium]